ncbi:hypothetical protein CC86DRAFT_461802 [Ophiobolus disseminans]|uniref:Uncharacterized protein n=1 Tax=Ophiobolus disseminans TaxID=1469910 RepID=A0A6A7AL55_9PLEO|nr:hypothetical protein CC86DRAFT_461802 [Ophiobolus disseminans]
MPTPTTTYTPSIQEMNNILYQRLVLKRTSILTTDAALILHKPFIQEISTEQRASSSQREAKEPNKQYLKLRSVPKKSNKRNGGEIQPSRSGRNKKRKGGDGPTRVKINFRGAFGDRQATVSLHTPEGQKGTEDIQPTSRVDSPVERPKSQRKGKRKAKVREAIQPPTPDPQVTAVTAASASNPERRATHQPTPSRKGKFKTLIFQPVYDESLEPPIYISNTTSSSLASAPAHSTRSALASANTSTTTRPTYSPHSIPDIIALEHEHPCDAWERLFPGTTFPEYPSKRDYRVDMGWKESYGGWYRRCDYEGDAWVPIGIEKPVRREWVQYVGSRDVR